MAKTEHSTVAGKVTMPAGQAPLPVARVAIFVGRLPAFKTEAATGVGGKTKTAGNLRCPPSDLFNRF